MFSVWKESALYKKKTNRACISYMGATDRILTNAASGEAVRVVALLSVPLGWVVEVLCEVVPEYWLELITHPLVLLHVLLFNN